MKKILFVICIALFLMVFPVRYGWTGDVIDHSLWGELLTQYVTDGMVDYKGFKKDESKLDKYLNLLENTDPNTLERNERFAFYINVYNAWTVKLILTGYPGIDSIKDLGNLLRSPWKKKIVRIKGNIITLDEVEHGILRPEFKDYRVHAAINCASKGCPPLRPEPFKGSTLDRQLEDSMTTFIRNPKYNYFSKDTLYVSQIFDWFGGDFKNNIIGVFQKYGDEMLKRELQPRKDRITIEYLDYDWSLNEH